MKKLLIIAFLLLSSTSPAFAQKQLYKWVDDQGNVHYTDQKPENQKADEINLSSAQPSSQPNQNSYQQSEYNKRVDRKLANYAKQNQQKRTANRKKHIKCKEAKQAFKKFVDSRDYKYRNKDNKALGYTYMTDREIERAKRRDQSTLSHYKRNVEKNCN